MVHYKLVYRPFRGRGEFIRYIFHQAGVEFEDYRIPYEEWPVLKPDTPLGHLPVLYVDGAALGNSTTIGWYLAKKFGTYVNLAIAGAGDQMFCPKFAESSFDSSFCHTGLAGKTDWEQAQANMIVCVVEEFLVAILEIATMIRDGDFKALMDWWMGKKPTLVIPYLKMMDKFLTETGSGWLVGSGLTYADLMAAQLHDLTETLDPTVRKDYPKLRDHCQRVHDLPNIRAYVATRPKTPF